MDLMTLAAKIELDDSDFQQGVKGAENMGQKLAGKMSAMAIAVGQMAADMAKKAVGSIKDAIGNAINSYADYEQLVGGVETLFKQSAGKVQKYAQQGFKTAGLSANQYMETVTSFSASLLQGLGGDTEQAAEMANMAIIDMADNANKMGTDMSAIQNAYQGFAKQNYTMLDNLKLGYGGTASEMVRLVNDSKILDHEIENLDGITFDQLVLAIHEVQNEMKITGTTAKEANDTISGSFNTLKSSWQNLITELGTKEGPSEETKTAFKTAFETYVSNLAPVIENALDNAPEMVDAVVSALTKLPTKGIKKLVDGGTKTGTSIFKGAKEIHTWLIKGLVNLFKGAVAEPEEIEELGKSIGEFLGSSIMDTIISAPTLILAPLEIGKKLAISFVEGLASGLLGLDDGVAAAVDEVNETMKEEIEDANVDSAKAEGIINFMKSLVEQYGDAADETEEWKKATEALEKVLPGSTDVVNEYSNGLGTALTRLEKLNDATRKFAIEEAKRKALKAKEDILTDAEAALLSVQSELYISEHQNNTARDKMVGFIRQYGADKSFTGEGLSSEQLTAAAYAELREAFPNGAGDEGYNEAAKNIKLWEGILSETDTEMEELKVQLPYLTSEVNAAKEQYALASAAMDDLIGGSKSAANYLYSLTNPETTYNSGEYANWYYSHKHATGISYVPTNGWRAELHKGEAVLTAAENAERRNGGGNAEVVGAIQGMRQDLQNLRLVVGQKNFGRAVVDYGGRGVNDYIGKSNSQEAAGYGT